MHNFNDQISDGQYRAMEQSWLFYVHGEGEKEGPDIEMQLWEESDVIPPLAALLPFGGAEGTDEIQTMITLVQKNCPALQSARELPDMSAQRYKGIDCDAICQPAIDKNDPICICECRHHREECPVHRVSTISFRRQWHRPMAQPRPHNNTKDDPRKVNTTGSLVTFTAVTQCAFQRAIEGVTMPEDMEFNVLFNNWQGVRLLPGALFEARLT
ncbi:hypothetical protein V8E54_007633 [Elaphomyces granulatus]